MKSCRLKLMVIVIVSLFFSACGGAGSSQTTYTLGGSVSGLLGTGLVLQNNGSNNLPVSVNGNFTFATRSAGGNAYHVTVLSQPSNPAQTCRIINGSGTISSNITGIGVSCAQNPASGLYLFEGTYGSSLNVTTIDSSTGVLALPVLASSEASIEGNLPGIAVDPSGQTLYALDASIASISGFSITGPGLQLRKITGSPFNSPFPNAGAVSLALHPTGRFLYAVSSPAGIQLFSVDASSGALTYDSVVPKMDNSWFVVIDPTGKFLYVPNLNQIFGYHINLTDGSLTPIAGSPFAVPANDQVFAAVFDSTGKYLYTPLSSGGVAAFALESSTGNLLQVLGSPFPTSAGIRPTFITADPAGPFIYVCNYDGPLDGFEVDSGSGALTPVAGSPFSTAARASSCTVDPSGQFVYVSINDVNSAIYGFRLNPSSGSLSPLVGSPFPSILNPTSLFAVKLQ